jgi:serine/threonine-protein kinase
MATFYRAARAGPGPQEEEVALKVIHSHLFEDQSFTARFRREVGISSSLIHPNIVTVLEAGMEESRHFIALELVQGNDLRSHLPPEGLPLEQAVGYLAPIYRAVAYAHGKGVVHRDLKPENVLIGPQGAPKLTDFGLARSQSFTTVTATGSVMGTPGYMAPEQIQGQPFDPATDQYALGVMTFELCTGRLPFAGEDVMQVIMKHLSSPAPAASSLNPQLPRALDELIARMLAKAPADRFPSVTEALQALEALGDPQNTRR